MSTWKEIAHSVSDFILAAEPFIAMAAPGAASAIHIADKLLQGVVAAEPTAVALYKRIVSGEIPAPSELQQYAADYEGAYQKLRADIAAKLAALPT